MDEHRKRKPTVIKNLADFMAMIPGFIGLGLVLVTCTVLIVGEPAVRECGCGRTVIVTMADRIISGLAFGTLSLPIFALGFFFAGMYSRAKQSLSEENLCQRLGVDEETLKRLLQERQIAPRFIIAEHPHYDWKDFGDTALLLRASSSPAGAEELLRAANTVPSTPSSQLLRPEAGPHETAETPIND